MSPPRNVGATALYWDVGATARYRMEIKHRNTERSTYCSDGVLQRGFSPGDCLLGSFRFFELPSQADTVNCSVERPCFLSHRGWCSRGRPVPGTAVRQLGPLRERNPERSAERERQNLCERERARARVWCWEKNHDTAPLKQ